MPERERERGVVEILSVRLQSGATFVCQSAERWNRKISVCVCVCVCVCEPFAASFRRRPYRSLLPTPRPFSCVDHCCVTHVLRVCVRARVCSQHFHPLLLNHLDNACATLRKSSQMQASCQVGFPPPEVHMASTHSLILASADTFPRI